MIDRGYDNDGNKRFRFETCTRCKCGHILEDIPELCECSMSESTVRSNCAEVCKWFEYRNPPYSDGTAEDGLKYRSKQGRELMTKFQWQNHGFLVKPDAVGEKMHPTTTDKRVCVYYDENDVYRKGTGPNISSKKSNSASQYSYKYNNKVPTSKQEVKKTNRLQSAYEFYAKYHEDCKKIEELCNKQMEETGDYTASFITNLLKQMGYNNLGFSGRELIRIFKGLA